MYCAAGRNDWMVAAFAGLSTITRDVASEGVEGRCLVEVEAVRVHVVAAGTNGR